MLSRKTEKKTRISEADVGEVVKAYLADCRQDVYCEVETPIGRVDIVGVEGRIITAVELKARLSMEVLGQAIHRSHYAHRSIAAFPMPKNDRYAASVLHAVHAATGIGIWEVDRVFQGIGHVRELYAPRILRTARTGYIRNSLCDEQKNQAAGVAMGYWSPFQDTKRRLIEFVREHPGCSLKEAMANIKHHYSSASTAYGSMGQWIRNGVITEIERRDGGLHVVVDHE